MTPLLELAGLHLDVREGDGSRRTLFDGLHLSMTPGDGAVALLGRSGSGKSTLLRVLAGLDVRWDGAYSFLGDPLPRSLTAMADFRLRHVGVVTQAHDLVGDLTVQHNVELGVHRRPDAARRAQEALDRVGLSGYERRRADRLSGGEAQRVAIARAIVKEPAIVIADEPTGALDEQTEDHVLELFRDLQLDGTTFVVATHSARVAAACERRVLLRGRRLEALD